MGGPVIETIREGVSFTSAAAASFRRAEAGWLAKTGRLIDCNSTYRDYGLQLSMWQAWTAWVEGRGPKPNHSRALHPDESAHCLGLALDTDDWSAPEFLDHMAEYGWIQTAAWDPTERHHLEYQIERDQHRYDPAPAGIPEEDDMPLTDTDLKKIAAAVWSYPIGENGVSGKNNQPAWKRLGWAQSGVQWVKDRIGGSVVKGSKTITHMVEWTMSKIGGTGKDRTIDEKVSEILSEVHKRDEDRS